MEEHGFDLLAVFSTPMEDGSAAKIRELYPVLRAVGGIAPEEYREAKDVLAALREAFTLPESEIESANSPTIMILADQIPRYADLRELLESKPSKLCVYFYFVHKPVLKLSNLRSHTVVIAFLF